MADGDPYDDNTEIASPGGKRKKKFIESSTQLKTEIYQGEPASQTPPPAVVANSSVDEVLPAIGTPPPRLLTENPPEIVERVQRVFDVADELLAGLGENTGTAVTAPGSPKSLKNPSTADETAIARPRRRSSGPHHGFDSGSSPFDADTADATGDAGVALGRAPALPELSGDDEMVTENTEDDDVGGETTQLEMQAPPEPPGDDTTQVEAAPPSELDGPLGGPTLAGHPGAPTVPLSNQPFAPGPLAPMSATPDSSGDGFATINTERAPQGLAANGLAPARFQDEPIPQARGGLRGMWDSVMRFFGRRPPPPPPPPTGDDDDDFSGYGRGTYTVANRLVERHGKRNRRPEE